MCIHKVTHKPVKLILACFHKDNEPFFEEIIIDFSQEFGYFTKVSRRIKISHLSELCILESFLYLPVNISMYFHVCIF